MFVAVSNAIADFVRFIFWGVESLTPFFILCFNVSLPLNFLSSRKREPRKEVNARRRALTDLAIECKVSSALFCYCNVGYRLKGQMRLPVMIHL